MSTGFPPLNHVAGTGKSSARRPNQRKIGHENNYFYGHVYLGLHFLMARNLFEASVATKYFDRERKKDEFISGFQNEAKDTTNNQSNNILFTLH
jgi:hypothetical protein